MSYLKLLPDLVKEDIEGRVYVEPGYEIESLDKSSLKLYKVEEIPDLVREEFDNNYDLKSGSVQLDEITIFLKEFTVDSSNLFFFESSSLCHTSWYFSGNGWIYLKKPNFVYYKRMIESIKLSDEANYKLMIELCKFINCKICGKEDDIKNLIVVTTSLFNCCRKYKTIYNEKINVHSSCVYQCDNTICKNLLCKSCINNYTTYEKYILEKINCSCRKTYSIKHLLIGNIYLNNIVTRTITGSIIGGFTGIIIGIVIVSRFWK